MITVRNFFSGIWRHFSISCGDHKLLQSPTAQNVAERRQQLVSQQGIQLAKLGRREAPAISLRPLQTGERVFFIKHLEIPLNGVQADNMNTPLTSTTSVLTILAVLLPVVLFSMSFLRRKRAFVVDGRTVLITGGSQGLGLSLARKLAARGANIVIVARDQSKLTAALGSIHSSAVSPTTQRFLSLSYDLTSPNSAPEILAKITEWNNGGPPDIVWCCAGFCIPSFFADASITTLREQMDTLYWSCAYMAHATLNLWKKPATSSSAASEASLKAHTSAKEVLPRHLIFTSSCLAFFPVAGYAPYSPAKAAMRALADTLQEELAVWNGARQSPSAQIAFTAPPAEIKISTIFPMGITSPNFDNENALKPEITKVMEKDDKPQTPEEVADAALRGLDAGETMITTIFIGALLKGCGMGASLRHGVTDVFFNFLGSVVAMIAAWDMWKKCASWGREKGMVTGPA